MHINESRLRALIRGMLLKEAKDYKQFSNSGLPKGVKSKIGSTSKIIVNQKHDTKENIGILVTSNDAVKRHFNALKAEKYGLSNKKAQDFILKIEKAVNAAGSKVIKFRDAKAGSIHDGVQVEERLIIMMNAGMVPSYKIMDKAKKLEPKYAEVTIGNKTITRGKFGNTEKVAPSFPELKSKEKGEEKISGDSAKEKISGLEYKKGAGGYEFGYNKKTGALYITKSPQKKSTSRAKPTFVSKTNKAYAPILKQVFDIEPKSASPSPTPPTPTAGTYKPEDGATVKVDGATIYSITVTDSGGITFITDHDGRGTSLRLSNDENSPDFNKMRQSAAGKFKNDLLMAIDNGDFSTSPGSSEPDPAELEEVKEDLFANIGPLDVIRKEPFLTDLDKADEKGNQGQVYTYEITGPGQIEINRIHVNRTAWRRNNILGIDVGVQIVKTGDDGEPGDSYFVLKEDFEEQGPKFVAVMDKIEDDLFEPYRPYGGDPVIPGEEK